MMGNMGERETEEVREPGYTEGNKMTAGLISMEPISASQTDRHMYVDTRAHTGTHTHKFKAISRAEQLPAVLRSGATGMGPAAYKWLRMLIGSQMGQGELNES